MRKFLILSGVFFIIFTGCRQKMSAAKKTYIYEERVSERNIFRLILKDCNYEETGIFYLEYGYTNDKKLIYEGYVKPVNVTLETMCFSFKDCYGNRILAAMEVEDSSKHIVLTCENFSRKGKKLDFVYGKTYVFRNDYLDNGIDLYIKSEVIRQESEKQVLWFQDFYSVAIIERNEQNVKFDFVRYINPFVPVIKEKGLIAKRIENSFIYRFDYTDGFSNEAYGYMVFKDEEDKIDFFIDCKRIPETGNIVWNLYDEEIICLQKVKKLM